MIRAGRREARSLLRRLAAARFPACRSPGTLRLYPSAISLRCGNPDKSVHRRTRAASCCSWVGGPRAARHVGPGAGYAFGNPRSEQADPYQRPGHSDQRPLSAHGEARRRVRAAALCVLHRRRRACARASGGAAAVSGRYRIASYRIGGGICEGREVRDSSACAPAACHGQSGVQRAHWADRGIPRKSLRPR